MAARNNASSGAAVLVPFAVGPQGRAILAEFGFALP
jgi:hypothetical protein